MHMLGAALGVVLYEVTAAEYEKAAKKDNAGYVISDKNGYIVCKGKVIGQRVDANKVRAVEGVSIDEVFPPKPQVVITERPTAEKLAREGEHKLQEVAKEGSDVVERELQKSAEVMARAKRKPRVKTV